jgi:hypothetical protein
MRCDSRRGGAQEILKNNPMQSRGRCETVNLEINPMQSASSEIDTSSRREGHESGRGRRNLKNSPMQSGRRHGWQRAWQTSRNNPMQRGREPHPPEH